MVLSYILAFPPSLRPRALFVWGSSTGLSVNKLARQSLVELAVVPDFEETVWSQAGMEAMVKRTEPVGEVVDQALGRTCGWIEVLTAAGMHLCIHFVRKDLTGGIFHLVDALGRVCSVSSMRKVRLSTFWFRRPSMQKTRRPIENGSASQAAANHAASVL